MSYIRCGWTNRYTKGRSESYVFWDGQEMEDYGGCPSKDLIEMLCAWGGSEDKEIKKYLIENLAKALDVKLRKKPLSFKEILKRMTADCKKLEKDLSHKAQKVEHKNDNGNKTEI